MPEEFDSIYRVVGFGDKARRMALYDIPRDDTVWVNTIGYDDEIRSVLENIDSGNVVEAIVTDAGDENEHWNLLDITITDDTLLYFVPTDGYTPNQTDDIWDERDEGSPIVTAGKRADDREDILYEVQLQAKEIESEDGDIIDVYSNLQRGELLTEPLFGGSGCDFLQDGAEAIIVVNPEDKPYLSMYLFPDTDRMFNKIWGMLYDYVETV